MYVARVDAESQAGRHGVSVGDVVASIDDVPMTSIRQVTDHIALQRMHERGCVLVLVKRHEEW